MIRFVQGQPACPVACRYCFITEHDARRAQWNANPVAGVNGACLFLNWSPWIGDSPEEQARFEQLPWEVCRGEVVGSTAITDPLWPKLARWWDLWADKAQENEAKILTSVTKWPLSRAQVMRLAQIPNFRLVVSITGRPDLERVETAKHLGTLALCKELGVKTLPICHPYIPGANLAWLGQLQGLGYNTVDFKGLRADARMMRFVQPQHRSAFAQDREVLVEDGWRQQVADLGLRLLSPKRWYLEEIEACGLGPSLEASEAHRLTAQSLALANVCSSAGVGEVVRACVHRRCLGGTAEERLLVPRG